MKYLSSEKKEILIRESTSTPLSVGERVTFVDRKGVSYTGTLIQFCNNNMCLFRRDCHSDERVHLDNVERVSYKIGSNPFNEMHGELRTSNKDLGSIVFELDLQGEKTGECIEGVAELNWNPFVFIDGEERYYQRDFVWTLEDNRLLIDSIYNGVSCGLIVVKKNSYDYCEKLHKSGDTEVAFADVVDGKQRLNAIRGFMNMEYMDNQGNYFNDLSNYAQHKFLNHQLFSFASMNENTSDSEILHQFLKMNHTGVPQSKEHIQFVKDLYGNI